MHFEGAIVTMSGPIDLLIQEADRHCQENRVSSAVALLHEAIAKHPDEPRLHQWLAVRLEQEQDLPAAAAHYKSAYELAPEKIYYRLTFAEFLRRQGQYEDILGVLPGFPPDDLSQADVLRWLKLRGYAMDFARRTNEAVACFSRVLALSPSDAQAADWLAIHAEDAGAFVEAAGHRATIAVQRRSSLDKPLKEMQELSPNLGDGLMGQAAALG